MLVKSLVILASLALASAKPVKRQDGASCAAPKPTLPKTGGDAELPPVPEGSVLKYIALGHGIQNYTCKEDGTAEAGGALAVLYDATALYPRNGPSALPSIDHFNALTTTALWASSLPLNSDGETQYGAPHAGPFPAAANLDLSGVDLPFLGHHIFDDAGVPTFFTGEQEDKADLLIKATLLNKQGAPKTADPGPVGTGAVAWLQLGDKGEGTSKGLSYVYRVVTAGGTAAECVNSQPQSVPYTTYYWLYGSASE